MSYEQLLELSDKLGHVSKGFSEEDIKLIPSKRVNPMDQEKTKQK
jgi:hypothetical protein